MFLFTMHLCPVCHKEFKQKGALLQHGCIHTESRPYGCQECGKAFRQQSHLMQHKRIHTNEKPYGCMYCGRNFRQRTILNQHVRIHTGEKPYKCYQCGKAFRQKAILDQHVRTHQTDPLIPCSMPNCRRKFVSELEIKKHLEKHALKISLKQEVVVEEKPIINELPPPPSLTPMIKQEFYLPPYYLPSFGMPPSNFFQLDSSTSSEYSLPAQ